MGGGRLPRSPQCRPGHRIRLQRERHSPGAGVSAPLGGSLQSGSQELRRPPVSRVGRAPRNRSSIRSHASTTWGSGWKSSRSSCPVSTIRRAELEALAGFLAGISPDIPWHVTAFHPDYKMTGPGAPPRRMLERAASIGRAAGLRYVYAGNLPGRVGELENTQLPELPGVAGGTIRLRSHPKQIDGERRLPALPIGDSGLLAARRATGSRELRRRSKNNVVDHMASSHATPFAGSWYPGRPRRVGGAPGRGSSTASLKRTGPSLLPRPLAFVVPHAGLEYSGTVAASAYRHLQAAKPERVFILGFTHRGGRPGVSIPDIGAFQTPLGEVKVDRAAARELASGGQFAMIAESRVCDHSVEIQLPLLQKAVAWRAGGSAVCGSSE